MGFLQYKVLNLLIVNVSTLAVRVIDQSCWIGLHFSVILDRRVGGGGQKGDREGLFGGGNYFKYFNQKRVIIQGDS